MGFCNCSLFCSALLCVHSSLAIISMGKRELVALLCLSSWWLLIVVWLFLTMPRVCLQFVIVVFHDHTHLLFFVTKIFSYLILWCNQIQSSDSCYNGCCIHHYIPWCQSAIFQFSKFSLYIFHTMTYDGPLRAKPSLIAKKLYRTNI